MSKSLSSLRARRTSPTLSEVESKLTEETIDRIAGDQEQLIELAQVRTDGGTQPRVSMDEETLTAYVERMILNSTGSIVDPEGVTWPPLEVFEDEHQQLWLADGFHRYMSAQKAGLTRFQARLHRGAQRDAILFSMGVNATHGKRRTNADKRRAVTIALQDSEWGSFANARIAKLCKVSSSFVDKLRLELEQEETIPFREVLFTEDDREIERHPPQRQTSASSYPSPPPSPMQAPAPSSAALSTSLEELRAAAPAKFTPASWLKLSKFKGVDGAVLFAQDERELDLFLAQAHLLFPKNKSAMVLLPIARRSSWLWRGPAALDALITRHGFEQPDLITIKSHARTYLVWARHRAYPDDVLHNKEALFSHGEDVLIVGTSLGGWS